MKNKLLLFCFLMLPVCAQDQSYFVSKKSSGEKPSQVKQDIAEIFESLLTQCCDMIASVAKQQRLIVKHLKSLAQGTGGLAEKNLQDLKKYRELLKTMEQDCKKWALLLETQINVLEKI